VKVSDLARGEVRQRGIQEINGVAITTPITEKFILMERIVDQPTFASMIRSGEHGRKAPVFLEIPLDMKLLDQKKMQFYFNYDIIWQVLQHSL